MRSTDSKSSIDIFDTGTAIFTPFILCRLIFPSFSARKSASTMNDFDLSVHVRTFAGFGSSLVSGAFFLSEGGDLLVLGLELLSVLESLLR